MRNQTFKVSRGYKLCQLALFSAVFFAMLAVYASFKGNFGSVLEMGLVWLVFMAFHYAVFIGRMQVRLGDRKLVCKKPNRVGLTEIAYEDIHGVSVQSRRFFSEVVLEYGVGRRVKLYPDDAERLRARLCEELGKRSSCN